ncbi:MAG: tRNA (adenosine(37)-N6)-threonylcarbamoyltransferase complex dimerization subunit type 1 TsaB [Ignavibacteria bacterium]|jgi:tRNA threonylcarbamoyladenosine biosynthesis protein TsaB
MNSSLPILSIETSGDACSVALMLNETEYFENTILKKHVHSEKLLLLVEEILKSADIRLKELNHIAVSIGPGSFTGLRIGLSAAKGIAFGAELPVVLVPTFEAYAYQLSCLLKGHSKFIIANKVNNEEIYYAKIKVNEKGNYFFEDALQIIDKNDLQISKINEPVYGNVYNNDSGFLSSPCAIFVARWSYLFGKDLLSFNIDFLEPFYLKNFIPKVKR